MIALPEAEIAFYYAAMEQLEPGLRPAFAERVANMLGTFSPFCDPGPGDVDRSVRAAFAELWVPPPIEEVKASSRWNQAKPKFERVSKRAY